MILLSFLGDNKYSETNYCWQGQSKRTTFFTAACVDFLKPGKVVLFRTEEADRRNGDALREALSAYSSDLTEVTIPLGKQEEELWQIFGLLNESVPDGEEVALDVTNGHRSVSLLGLLAAAFMRTARDIEIRHLLYGAFNIDKTNAPDVSPVFDLSPMLDLLNWSVAADRFNRSGDSHDMAELLNDYGTEIKQQAHGNKEELKRGSAFLKMAKSLNNVTDALYLLRPYDVMENTAYLEKTIRQAIPVLEDSPRSKPLEFLLSRILGTYTPLSASAEERKEQDPILALRKEQKMIFWYYERDLWVQTISLTREWLISWIMVWFGEKEVLEKSRREGYEKNISLFVWPEGKTEKTEWTDADIDRLMPVKQFRKLWQDVTDSRNDIDHAGHRKNSRSSESLKQMIRNCVETIRELSLPSSPEEH